MNANEVISNRAIELLGGEMGSKKPVHPNDHVNTRQSSNDMFPTAMHIAAAAQVERDADPGAASICATALEAKAEAFADIVKIGRTHLQDATPLTLGQEFSGYAAQVALRHRPRASRRCRASISWRRAARRSAPASIARSASPSASPRKSRAITGLPFVTAAEQVRGAGGARRRWCELSGALNTLAASLFKIANDIRLLGSGPRCGIGEIVAAGERAGLVDHAGQGQPDPVRGDDHGLRAGDGQPRHRSPSPAARAISS